MPGMSIGIRGVGWVTPAGRSTGAVWPAVCAQARPPAAVAANPLTGREFPIVLADRTCLGDVERLPRVRRSSTISLLALAAALDALADAGIDARACGERLALVFASSDGGVIYTRRFFAGIAAEGAQAGSPLLFPETVYNAPASHAAACLGIAGTALTLVGDAATGIAALDVAAGLVESGECDLCLVVAAEEADWILCEAYARWKLAAADREIAPFSGRGTVFAEGAAAVVLGRDAAFGTLEIHPGFSYRGIAEGAARHAAVLESLVIDRQPGLIVASASGARFDAIEQRVFARLAPATPVLTPKVTLGESFAAAALAQVICASLWLRDAPAASSALVSVVGLNGQLASLRVDR
jgi:3-oxoacyl-(acyl-carrier-protein) synthase